MRISDWSSDVCSSDLKTVIIVCSGSLRKAYDKVKPFGDFFVIGYFSMDYLYRHLNELRTLALLPAERKAPRRSRLGIVVRGRIEGTTTIQICRKFAQDYPDAYLVASTWKDTAPDQLDALEPVCSEEIGRAHV